MEGAKPLLSSHCVIHKQQQREGFQSIMDFAGYMLLLLWNRYTLTFPRELSAVYSGKPSRLFAAIKHYMARYVHQL